MNQPKIAVVIEGDGDIAMLLEAVLQRSGAIVHTTRTGAAGIKAVRTHRPQLVTVDMGLPDIDGCEVTQRIRDFSDAHILLISSPTDRLAALFTAGVDDVITKPFSPRELHSRAEAVLGTHPIFLSQPSSPLEG